MNKVIVLASLILAALVGQAASLDWKYTATAAENGKSVYVLIGDTAQTTWESLADLQAASVSQGTIAKVGRSGYASNGTAENDALTKTSANVYYVIVAADGSTFDVTSVANMSSSVYGAQDSSPGADSSLSNSSIVSSGNSFGGGGDVPEPTSGLLLLLGGAMLALRRRRA